MPLRWWALALAAATLALFAPVREFQFVNFDDDVFVFDNEHVRSGLTLAGIKWAFSSADIDYWRPLSWLSHMLDVQLFGLNAGGHHVTSVMLHTANAVLLLYALHALTGRHLPCLLVAALFAWHPAHVESVAWVGERKDVLCTTFWFLGLWTYARYARSPERKGLLLVGVCFALGLMTKPMILTFPFLLLVLDVWPLRRVEFTGEWRASLAHLRPLVTEKLPLFALMILAAVGTYFAQRNVGAIMAEEVHPLSARLANVPVAYVRYLGLTLWPVDLSILYPMPDGWHAWVVTGAVTLVLLASWLALRRLGREPWLAAGWCWFLGTLVPVIGLVQVGNQSIADRYTYVPMVGLFLAMAWWLDAVREQRPAWSTGLTSAACVALAMCALGTHLSLPHWRNGITIFEQAVRVTQANYIAMTNLGNNLARAGQQQRAIDLYQQALRFSPTNAQTHYNLAMSLADTGQPAAAERHYREALRWNPRHSLAHNNLANLLGDTGRVPEAIQHYEDCLRLNPRHLEARFNYGITLADAGKPVEAIAQFEAAVNLRPGFTRARLQLVNLYIGLGKAGEARAHSEALLRYDPNSPEGHFNAGSLAAASGDWPAAIQHWQEALRLKPDLLPAAHRLAWTFATHPNATVRNPKAALELAGHFARLTGGKNPEALDLLAIAHAANGAYEPATQHAQLALAAAGTNSTLAAELRTRLALFRSGKPFIEGQPR